MLKSVWLSELTTSAEAPVPEWVHVLPATTQVGADGRKLVIDDLKAVLENTLARSTRVYVSIGHNDDYGSAAAVGWAVDYALRPDGLWARVDWLDTGKAAVSSKAYRYISPGVLKNNKGVTEVLYEIALVNAPNLTLTALNSRQDTGDPDMDLEKMLAELRSALDVRDDECGPEALIDLIKEAHAARVKAEAEAKGSKEAHAVSHDLDGFVPRADYDALKAKVDELVAGSAAQLEATIAGEVDAAIRAGKVAPASREYHAAQCHTEGGLERFRQYAATAASHFEAHAAARPVVREPVKQLTENQIALCKAGGIKPEAYIAELNKGQI